MSVFSIASDISMERKSHDSDTLAEYGAQYSASFNRFFVAITIFSREAIVVAVLPHANNQP